MILPQLFGKLKGHRPKLVYFEKSSDLLIESFKMHNSPSFHLQLDDVTHPLPEPVASETSLGGTG